MANDPPAPSLYLFKETRVDLEPDLVSSVIEFQVPSSAISFSRVSRPKRQILRTLPAYKGEEAFSTSALASAGSIYFDRSDRYPRSFLWRLLEDNKVLEIRSVDLNKNDEEEDEASLILRFHFPATIRPGGIALADAEDQSNLNIFVLTISNELYTLDIRKSFFCHASASEEDIERWCKSFKPASTTFSTPHQFIAANSLEIFIALSDGRLLQLTRPSGSDGASWHELACNDGHWGSSLRSFVRWQGSNTVRYGNAMLDQETSQSIAYSPNKKHLWMVCLNHTLKVRNMKQSKTVYTTDLLGVTREPHEITKLLLDPSNSNMLQLFEIPNLIEGDQYYLMTFSPNDLGQFKFWAIRDADAGAKGIRDLYPDDRFLPPDPDPNPDSKAIWKVADFKVKAVEKGSFSSLRIWMLMRSNRRWKLYSLSLLAVEFRNSMRDAWNKDWSVVTSEFVDHATQLEITGVEPEGVIETWLDFIFQPGKYSRSVIETALSVYATTRRSRLSLDSKGSLRENMRLLVSSQVTLQRLGSDSMDFKAYRAGLNSEFVELWQEIRDLDAGRWENGSLVYDDQRDMPWLVFADGCSLIRACSQPEIIAHNPPEELKSAPDESSLQFQLQDSEDDDDRVLPHEIAMLVAAAANFRQSFSQELLQNCDTVLASELWQEPSHAASTRIQQIYDTCAFGSEIEDKAFTCLVSQLDPIGGFDGLRNTHVKAITSSLLRTMSEQPSSLRSTRFGLKALVRGIQDVVTLSRKLLYDLLILVIVVEVEADREDTPMEEFEAEQLFVEILDILKKLQIVHWLAVNVRIEPSKFPHEPGLETTTSFSQARESTILEHLFALDVSPRLHSASSEATAFTETMQDIMAWVMGGSYAVKLDDVIVRIQCNLLTHSDIDLATEFLCYQPSTSWATYIKGRFYLMKGEFTEAALYFQKASFGISGPGDHTDPATSDGLLSSAEVAHLGQGLLAYFTHIQDLFQKAACPGYVATFARKSLQLTLHPSRQVVPITTLFHACVSTSDFDSAFTALTRLSIDNASELIPAFLTALLAEDEFNKALDLPWPPRLLPHIETFLARKASKAPVVVFYNSSAPQYNKLLAAWRMRYFDYRGAAAALLAHLQRLQKSRNLSSMRGESDEIITTLLSIINLLACCGGEDEAWVLTDAFYELHPRAKLMPKDDIKKKRALVTIKDVRARYQKELDKRSMLENGRWSFGLDGAGDEEEEDLMDVEEGEKAR
ncbi:MAG: hypothetical protein Q9195_002929 [Heterodermia aff. obscurata]